MLVSFLAILAGFALLIWGADKFVLGASGTASNLGISPLVIGLTVVGFGTSAPEMIVSFMAAWNGNPEIAVGNAIGSNIANIGLVLGITALVVPLSVHSKVLKREYPMMFIVMLLAWYLLFDQQLSLSDGIILISSMVLVLTLITLLGIHDQKNTDEPLNLEFSDEIPKDITTRASILWLLAGLVLLLISSKMLVWGAVNVAREFGVSDLIIGLTIVAIGTSLPELAASIAGALKGEHDIAIGNVIGSNMFNLLGVLGIPAIVHPHQFSATVLSRDYPVMIGLSIALFVFAYGFRGQGRINRWEGFLLLTTYAIYMYFIYRSI